MYIKESYQTDNIEAYDLDLEADLDLPQFSPYINDSYDLSEEFHFYLENYKYRNEEQTWLGSFFGKVWNLPNTAIGLAWGLIGTAFGAEISLGNNSIQFENHPFMKKERAVTIGNVITYGTLTSPELVGDHERQHTYQGQVMGPLYLIGHLFEGFQALIKDGNWHGESNNLEKGPMNMQNPKPW